MEEIIGLVAIYIWVHGAVICFKKIKDATQYESVVLVAGLVAFVLYIFGTSF